MFYPRNGNPPPLQTNHLFSLLTSFKQRLKENITEKENSGGLKLIISKILKKVESKKNVLYISGTSDPLPPTPATVREAALQPEGAE